MVDDGDVGAGGGGGGAEAQHREHRNGTWGRPEQVQQTKEAMVAEVFQDLVDDLLREVVFEMHRKAKMGLTCFNCEDQYPSGILDKNGYDIFGQAVSGKVVTGEVRFDCLNCGRTVVASRYAPHLEKCMGIGRMARNSSRIASRRMKALDDDVYTPNPSLYMASPSFEDDDDEDDDDATYGEHGKQRALLMLKEEAHTGDELLHAAMLPPDEQHGTSGTRGGPGLTAKQHQGKRAAAALGGGGAGLASAAVAKARGGVVRKQPPKKKGRASAPEAESALISFGIDDDEAFADGDDIEVVEEMEAGVAGDGQHLYDMVEVEEDGLAAASDEHEEKTTAKRKGKLAGRGRGRGRGGAAK